MAAACIAVGLFTRIAAAMIGIEMLVIVFVFQWQFGYFWTARGYEYALLRLLLCIAIFSKGGRRYSIDRLIGGVLIAIIPAGSRPESKRRAWLSPRSSG